MNIDVARITGQLNAFWASYGQLVILATGLAALCLAVAGIVRVVRSHQRDRWISGLTAMVVLAWTSEGLWEVARGPLALPIPFAVMTFFVFEAMMLTSSMQAEHHRRRRGTPGPAGRYVWVLASITATVVAVNAATVVEALLRFVLPLAAAGLWWVGITAERDSDTPEVRAQREQAAQRRQATWAVTPRTVLVALGLMRPGDVDISAAERERHLRRMVVAADRVHAGGWSARRAGARLRRLARSASADDVAEVRDRVARSVGIVALVCPGGRDTATTTATPSVDAVATRTATPSATRTATDDATDVAPDVATGDAKLSRQLSPQNATRGATRGRQRGRQKTRQTNADRVATAVAKNPDTTPTAVATRLGINVRTVQRYWPVGSRDTVGRINGHELPGEEASA